MIKHYRDTRSLPLARLSPIHVYSHSNNCWYQAVLRFPLLDQALTGYNPPSIWTAVSRFYQETLQERNQAQHYITPVSLLLWQAGYLPNSGLVWLPNSCQGSNSLRFCQSGSQILDHTILRKR